MKKAYETVQLMEDIQCDDIIAFVSGNRSCSVCQPRSLALRYLRYPDCEERSTIVSCPDEPRDARSAIQL